MPNAVIFGQTRNRYATVLPRTQGPLQQPGHIGMKTEIQPYKSIARFDVWGLQHIRLPVNRVIQCL